MKLGEGPSNAKIMLVGDFLSPNGGILSGSHGAELDRMLHEAGILRSECFITCACPIPEPVNALAETKKDKTSKHIETGGKWVLPCILEGLEKLNREISLVKPNVIIAFGNLPMWALTGEWGILKWRGSQLTSHLGHKVIPTVHPSTIIRQWDLRTAAINDLKRAANEQNTPDYRGQPAWNFIIRPSLDQVLNCIGTLLEKLESGQFGDWDGWLDFDYETRNGHIACAGFSWSLTDALCIPFMDTKNPAGYWSLEEEAIIVHQLYRLLTHRRLCVRGQNLLFDCQYSYRHWHFVPRVRQDTMISWHTMFAGLPKRLDYQASILCDWYTYWKEDHKSGLKTGA